MVCTANEILSWKDFPKGLRVLLLDEDSSSAAEIKSNLEEMDYIVSTFYSENEALLAISNQSESFHVAIVEVSADNSDGRVKFLEGAKDVPTIMTSNMCCLSTMMKCIALGAVEFLMRPLSEDKLRNIWQHVVHKAFNAGGKDVYESLKPITKGSVVSMLQLQLENEESKNQISVGTEHATEVQENNQEELSADNNDKYPAPSTPQLKQGARLLDDGDCQNQTNFSGDQDVECKSVETTFDNSVAEITGDASPPQRSEEDVIKKEDESADGFKGESINISSPPQNIDSPSNFRGDTANCNKASGFHHSGGTKSNKKKIKVGWTPELHKKFVKAVEQLGVNQAIPSRILELMKVEGLTRHNVASHLQKYRMHRREILPKEGDRRWPCVSDSIRRGYYPHKPVMALPTYNSNNTFSPSQVYSGWGLPGSYSAGVPMWSPHSYPTWQLTENWHWRPYHGMHTDAWGCPVMPPPLRHFSSYPQGFDRMQNNYRMPKISFDYPADEVIDKVVKEAISKPWLPLPLGLKPPPTESLLAELSKQGISTIPPPLNGTRPC